MELQPILHVWIHPDNDLMDLTITTPAKTKHGSAPNAQSEVVHTNQKHPFLTTEHGFLPIKQITVGMHVVRADGRIGLITRWTSVPGVKMMYNLEVAQNHTFTVGDGQWVVHNCGEMGDHSLSASDNASPNDRTPSGSLQRVDDKYLKRNGIDAHALKNDNNLIPGAHYNIYKDREEYLFGLENNSTQDKAVYLWHNLRWGRHQGLLLQTVLAIDELA